MIMERRVIFCIYTCWGHSEKIKIDQPTNRLTWFPKEQSEGKERKRERWGLEGK